MPRFLTLCIAILLLIPGTALALDCTPPPQSLGEGEESAKLDASAAALVEALGTSGFARAQTDAQEAFRRDHAEDELVAKLMLLHAVCSRLAADRDLSESVKREKLLEFEKSLEYRRGSRARGARLEETPAAIEKDDAFTEAILLVRTAGVGRTAAPSVRAGLLVDGASIAETPPLQAATLPGDLEELRMALSPPLPVSHCRNLALEVSIDGVQDDDWSFHVAGAILRTRKGQAIFDLFVPVAPVELNARNRTKYLDPRQEACSRRSL